MNSAEDQMEYLEEENFSYEKHITSAYLILNVT